MAKRPAIHRRATLQETVNLYQLRHGQAQSTPRIALRGQWLAQAVFQAVQRVNVRVEQGQLIITPAQYQHRGRLRPAHNL